ncbi:hypothetical protein G7046_g6790 [Stylonectria norvegica]|nr:hypothetical protein G7046_g6790 [Stylonectria norvegica]
MPSLFGLPIEIQLNVLEQFPDLASLKEAYKAVPEFDPVLRTYKNSVFHKVIKNEFSPELYTHAVVAHWARQGYLNMPSMYQPQEGFMSNEQIDGWVDKITKLREAVPMASLTASDAVAIHDFRCKVKSLSNHFLRQCTTKLHPDARVELEPLRASLQKRRPTHAEHIRIQQAIYLYEILACICRNMLHFLPADIKPMYEEKVRYFTTILMGKAMAPWEMYQVCTITSYFERTLYDQREQSLSTQILPHILTLGIDTMHRAICKLTPNQQGLFIFDVQNYFIDKGALLQTPHNSPKVLSRGHRNDWSRLPTKDYDAYAPFHPGDVTAYDAWVVIEARQAEEWKNVEPWTNVLDRRLKLVEDRLDVLSVALWDRERFDEDMRSTVKTQPGRWMRPGVEVMSPLVEGWYNMLDFMMPLEDVGHFFE